MFKRWAPLNTTPCISNLFSLIISKANSISSNSSVQQKLGKVFLPLLKYLAKNMNGRNSSWHDNLFCHTQAKEAVTISEGIFLLCPLIIKEPRILNTELVFWSQYILCRAILFWCMQEFTEKVTLLSPLSSTFWKVLYY